MSVALSWILAASLSFAAPAEGETRAPSIVVTPAPSSAPAPPAAPPVWGPSADVAVSAPISNRPAPAPAPAPARVPAATPPPEPMLGVGLYVSSAVAFTIGLAARLSQFDVAARNCTNFQASAGLPFASQTRCFDSYDPPGLDSNDVFVGAAYGASIVMGMIASGALGRHSAWMSVFADGELRKAKVRTAFGATFSALGVASIASHFVLVSANMRNPCTSWECNMQRRALWMATSDGGALLLNAGFGLLSWGAHYKGNLAGYQRMQWSVLPGAGAAGSVGATASVRF